MDGHSGLMITRVEGMGLSVHFYLAMRAFILQPLEREFDRQAITTCATKMHTLDGASQYGRLVKACKSVLHV